MQPHRPAKTERLETRLTPEILELVRHAAKLQGRSVNDFVLAAAQEAARKTIEEHHLIRLSLEDQQHFVETLLNPPEISPAMERAKEAHARLIRESK
jgi:uncharacterized protein (DUF1778 family)